MITLPSKDLIAEWMFQATKDYYMKESAFPDDTELERIVNCIYNKIASADIWIPYQDLMKQCLSMQADVNLRVKHSLNEASGNHLDLVCFTNMCMIRDNKGNVLALDKVNDSYTGTTFPGGHVEPNETFHQSIIREVWEETGLQIKNPKFSGLYHWHKDGIHHVITLYQADTFSGRLISSEEGQVYWISLEELKTRKLADGMEYVLRMLESGNIEECYLRLEKDGYTGSLY